jgi:hypothetical protein
MDLEVRTELMSLLVLAHADLYDAAEGKVVPGPRVASALQYVKEALKLVNAQTVSGEQK